MLQLALRVVDVGLRSIRERMSRGLSEPLGSRVAAVMRAGPGSVTDQFERQATLDLAGGITPWPRTRPFGTRPIPARTLHVSGALRRAWNGRGPGGFVRISAEAVVIGVDETAFPAAGVQMTGATVRPVKVGKRGRSAMGWKLGMTFGVWLSEAKLRRGLRIPARPLSVNPQMLDRANDLVATYVATGKLREAAA